MGVTNGARVFRLLRSATIPAQAGGFAEARQRLRQSSRQSFWGAKSYPIVFSRCRHWENRHLACLLFAQAGSICSQWLNLCVSNSLCLKLHRAYCGNRVDSTAEQISNVIPAKYFHPLPTTRFSLAVVITNGASPVCRSCSGRRLREGSTKFATKFFGMQKLPYRLFAARPRGGLACLSFAQAGSICSQWLNLCVSNSLCLKPHRAYYGNWVGSTAEQISGVTPAKYVHPSPRWLTDYRQISNLTL